MQTLILLHYIILLYHGSEASCSSTSRSPTREHVVYKAASEVIVVVAFDSLMHDRAHEWTSLRHAAKSTQRENETSNVSIRRDKPMRIAKRNKTQLPSCAHTVAASYTASQRRRKHDIVTTSTIALQCRTTAKPSRHAKTQLVCRNQRCWMRTHARTGVACCWSCSRNGPRRINAWHRHSGADRQTTNYEV